MVGRRLREHRCTRAPFSQAAFTPFSTFSARIPSARATDLDTELFEQIRELFRRNWENGSGVRLLGCTFPPVRGRMSS